MNFLTCSGSITQTPEGYPLCASGWSFKTEEQVITELGIGPMSPEDFDYLFGELVMLFVIVAGLVLVKSIILQPVRN